MSRENFGIELSVKTGKDEYTTATVMVSHITHMIEKDGHTELFFGAASITVRETTKLIFQKGGNYGVFKILTSNI